MPSNVKVTIFSKKLLKEITSGGNEKTFKTKLNKFISPRIKKAQKKLIQDFSQHPVTKEIEAGPKSTNSSGLLGGYGNLFSFIGFDEGTKPTEIVKIILNKPVKFKIVKKGRAGQFSLEIKDFSKENVFEASPIPWMLNKSWVQGIETGISGLGQFLYKPNGSKYSRSSTAIQSTSKIRSGAMTRTSYLSEMFNKFRKQILQK